MVIWSGSSLANSDPLPQKVSEDTAIPNQFFTPPVVSSRVISASSSKDEPAGATKGQPWTRATAVESAKFIAECFRSATSGSKPQGS